MENISFIAIGLRQFLPDEPPPFSLYLEHNGHYVKFSSPHTGFTPAHHEMLLANRITHLFVESQEYSLYQHYNERHVSLIAQNESLSLEEKSHIIYDSAGEIMRDLFERPINQENLARTKRMVHTVIDKILVDRNAFLSLMKVTSYDYYTYTHCVNVSIYAIGLGMELGLSKKELHKLGHGAILHDVGKSRIDPAIVNKPDRLSVDEFRIMKKHSILGDELLREQGESDPDILSIVRHHHEKCNGTGYPDGISDTDLTYFAKIVAVADIFDALTTRRSYKEALTTFTALRIMRNQMSNELCPKILERFIYLLGGRFRL